MRHSADTQSFLIVTGSLVVSRIYLLAALGWMTLVSQGQLSKAPLQLLTTHRLQAISLQRQA